MAQISLDRLNRGFRLGEWEVLPQRACIRSGDEDIRLEPGVMKVLPALAQRNSDPVSRDELVDEVWGRRTADGPIDRRIASLRKAFGDREEPRRYIGVQAYWRANRCEFRDGEVSCQGGL